MSLARTAMLDLHLDSSVLSDSGQRDTVIQTVEKLLGTIALQKQHEFMIGENPVIFYAVPDGSVTCMLKIYLHGLITLTFEECLKVSLFTNLKLEEFQIFLRKQLKIRVERVPVVKRGSKVPVYFTTADERLLEYDFDQVVYEANSEYQNIKILHSPTIGNCLFLDDLQNLGDKDIDYTYGLMKKGTLSYLNKEVLILGGGDGGLLHELLKEKPKFVTMVDIDEMVINSCREHLRGVCGDSLDSLIGSNYVVIVEDCVKKLSQYKAEGRTFDYVINDLTDIPISTSPQGELWQFVKTIVTMSLDILKEDGHYLNHAIGLGCKEVMKTYEEMLTNLPVKLQFKNHSAFVPSFMETWVFYDIWKA